MPLAAASWAKGHRLDAKRCETHSQSVCTSSPLEPILFATMVSVDWNRTTNAFPGCGRGQCPNPWLASFALIESGELVRLLPGWYGDAGPLELYYPTRRMLPAKTKAFVDFGLKRFRMAGFARSVDGR
jgi:DNA-binding transcriptional LysR family regulator